MGQNPNFYQKFVLEASLISFTSLIHLAVGSVPALLQDNGLLLVQINLPLVLGSSILMPIITVLSNRWIPFCFVKIVYCFYLLQGLRWRGVVICLQDKKLQEIIQKSIPIELIQPNQFQFHHCFKRMGQRKHYTPVQGNSLI